MLTLVVGDCCSLFLLYLHSFLHTFEGSLKPAHLHDGRILHSSLRCFLQCPECLFHDKVWVPEEAELASHADVLLLRPDLVEITPESSHCTLPTFLM